MTNNEAPKLYSKVRAVTLGSTQQSVVIEVTAIDCESELGWYVWGYRQYKSRTRRQSSIPGQYFVAKS